jgi:hypothetical protein
MWLTGEMMDQTPCQGDSVFTGKHSKQADQRDGWRCGRPYIDDVVKQADRNADGDRDKIGFHDGIDGSVK